MYVKNCADYSKYDTIVGYDGSYSTDLRCSGETVFFYHSFTQNLIENMDDKKTGFVLWDNKHKIISKAELKDINKERKGFNGTDPSSFFRFLKDINFKGKLIFISDGQITNDCLIQCSDILLNWIFESVSVYLIYTGGSINESVSCALTRNSPHRIELYRDSKSHITKNPEVTNISNDDFKAVHNTDSINTVVEFTTQKEVLTKVLASMNIGTSGNKEMHDKLVAMKNRLIKSESKKYLNTEHNPVSKLVDSFQSLDTSIEKLDDVWKLYYNIDDDDDWKKDIDRFISWCSGSLLTIFDRSNISNREIKAVEAPVTPTDAAEVLEEKPTDLKLYCPIAMTETSNMVILMKKSNVSIFGNLSKDIIDSIINCPLNVLRHLDILGYIKSLLDCAISIEAYKELVDYGISDKSPLTRDDIFGGLCLGKDKSHAQATNSTLRHVLTAGKSLGNIDLWFSIIYFLIARGQVEHLNEYLPMVKEHLEFRLLNSKSYMCLSGLPTYPTYSVPIGLALWSSVMATTSSLELIKNPKNDPIRLHLPYSLDIIELLGLLGINVPNKLISHINRLKTLRHFLLESKKSKDHFLRLTNLVDALYYSAIETSELWILIDGTPSDMQLTKVRSALPSCCTTLSITEIKDILDLCDRNKSECDIYIPYNYEVKTYTKINTKNWSYGNDVPYNKVAISSNTCRPYYNIIDNGKKKTWLDKATEIYGTKLFSTNNFFGTYISENKKYPSKHEFLNYLFLYHLTRSKKTLPVCIEQFVNEAFIEYADIMKAIYPEEFAERWNKSVYKDVRIVMEQ